MTPTPNDIETFRESVREFIGAEFEPEAAGGQFPAGENEAKRRFLAKLAERGWLGLDWPIEYGGQGLSEIYRVVLQEELDYLGLPSLSVEMGVGHVIARHGSEALKREYLPRIVAGRLNVALALSEPEAGSDLAGLRLRATRDGDEFVLDGQKMWTSAAHFADVIWLACRTNSSAPKHKGISILIVDTQSQGIEVRPLYTMGDHRTNLVYFSGVRVPISRLVGEVDRGWDYLVDALDYERLGFPFGGLQRDFDEFVAWAREDANWARPDVRELAARLSVRVEGARTHLDRACARTAEGLSPTIDVTMLKIALTETRQDMANDILDVLGPAGVLRSGNDAPMRARFEQAWRREIINTIAGGANELMRNILARRHLGLPIK